MYTYTRTNYLKNITLFKQNSGRVLLSRGGFTIGVKMRFVRDYSFYLNLNIYLISEINAMT